MKKILATMMALALTVAAQAQNDSIDQAQFVVAYDLVTNTTDRTGNAVTDSVRLAVVVGSHTAMCKEFNRAMMENFGEGSNKDNQFGEWVARKYNLFVLYVGYPEGEVSVFDKITPNRYFYTEPLPDFQWELTDDTLTGADTCVRKPSANMAAGRGRSGTRRKCRHPTARGSCADCQA